MHPASRILWMKAKSLHLWILSAKHDGSTARMWPSTPKAISSWIPQAQKGNKRKPTSQKGLWISMQSNYLPLVPCSNFNSSSSFCLLVARVSWSYLQWTFALLLPWTNAWLPTSFRGNALIPFFCQTCPSLTMIFVTYWRIQCLPLELGQFLTAQQVQFLLWDLSPQLWLSWCVDMLQWTQLL
jgi:hypothetical protein